jgi:mannose/cellobiose epimerase-like protein (N-acyl-D-glucosamine 2-epimerase family)
MHEGRLRGDGAPVRIGCDMLDSMWNRGWDEEYGEWYGYLHRDGSVSTTLKGGLWKSFFHHPRMQWYCWQLLERARPPLG